MIPLLVGVPCVNPEGRLPGFGLMSENPRSRPESGSAVVLLWTLLGCISSKDGLMRPAVAGVLGAWGEETMASRFDCGPRGGVSSCSTRDARWIGVWLSDYAERRVSKMTCWLCSERRGYRNLPCLGLCCDLEVEMIDEEATC